MRATNHRHRTRMRRRAAVLGQRRRQREEPTCIGHAVKQCGGYLISFGSATRHLETRLGNMQTTQTTPRFLSAINAERESTSDEEVSDTGLSLSALLSSSAAVRFDAARGTTRNGLHRRSSEQPPRCRPECKASPVGAVIPRHHPRLTSGIGDHPLT